MKKIFPIVAAVVVVIVAMWLVVTSQDGGEVVAVPPYEYAYPAGFVFEDAVDEGESYQERYFHPSYIDEYPANIVVFAVQGSINVGLELHAKETVTLTQQDPSVQSISIIEEGATEIDGAEGYYLTTRVTDSEGAFFQKQVFYEGGEYIVYITLSTSVDAFEELESVFDSSLSTFTLTGSGTEIEV